MLTASELRCLILRIITWDGLLPGIVWSAPGLVRRVVPIHRGPVEIAAVILPTIAAPLETVKGPAGMAFLAAVAYSGADDRGKREGILAVLKWR